MDLDALLEAAVGHHQRGELARAADLYEAALARAPHDADALHLLGLVRLQQGNAAAAAGLIARAIEQDPSVGEYHVNLAKALGAQGFGDAAIAALRKATSVAPELSEAHLLLGMALEQRAGGREEAHACFAKAVELNPRDPVPRHRLGVMLAQTGRFPEAAVHLREAVALAPQFAMAHMHLGNTLKAMGNANAAVAELRTAVALTPRDAEAHYSLGVALQAMGQFAPAEEAYRAALSLRPDYVEALNNLGLVFYMQRRYAEALPYHQKAVQLRPTHANAQCGLGMDSFALGMVDEAIAAYRAAVALDPSDAATHALLAVSMHYSASVSPEEVFSQYVAWAQRHVEPLGESARLHHNAPDPDRKLRVGFLSADFIEHPVGFFIEPVLQRLDREHFKVICYKAGPWNDDLTDRLRGLASEWRDVDAMSDEALAEQIRQDRVDVLLDLSGLTLGHRLLAVARKPAPVQATYLGFPSSTGMSSVDYRITDVWVDPAGMTEHLHTETLLRLPKAFACYRAPAKAPRVSPLPAERNGYVTFGSLNVAHKVTPGMLAVWCRLLKRVAGSRLIMVVEDDARPRIAEMIRAAGVDSGRVDLLARKSYAEYLALFASIDIALDTYPFNGHTTTCDCLWMGLPVVSRAGKSADRRAGVSVMNNVGLPEWVAEDEHGYLEIATGLAVDIQRLTELRSTMRERMRGSPMMNEGEFAEEIGRAIRGMWREWCEKQGH